MLWTTILLGRRRKDDKMNMWFSNWAKAQVRNTCETSHILCSTMLNTKHVKVSTYFEIIEKWSRGVDRTQVNWLILPVIIFFDQRLSHARVRTLSFLRVCVWLIIWFITCPSTFHIGTSEVIHGLTLHEKEFRKEFLHLLVSNQYS